MIQFVEVLRVCVESGLAPLSIIQPNTMLEYNGMEWEYYAFVWTDFFLDVWPKVRELCHRVEPRFSLDGVIVDVDA